jgi:hypothetical protein
MQKKCITKLKTQCPTHQHIKHLPTIINQMPFEGLAKHKSLTTPKIRTTNLGTAYSHMGTQLMELDETTCEIL